MSKNNKKLSIIHESNSKILYRGTLPHIAIQHFKDAVTSRTREKDSIQINGKGSINNQISAFIMSRLAAVGVSTHFVEMINMREQAVLLLEMLPLKIVVRNMASGNLVQNFDLIHGDILLYPIIEFYIKSKETGQDVLINDEHAALFLNIALDDLSYLKITSLKISNILQGIFLGINFGLMDIKLEFGLPHKNNHELFILGDEINPDTFNLWDIANKEPLQKDVLADNTNNPYNSYCKIAQKLGLVNML